MNEWSKEKYSLIKSASLDSTSKIKIATGTTVSASTVAPVVGGMIAGVAGVGLYGIANISRYIKKEKSGKQAIKDTVAHSTGLGISAALGTATAEIAAFKTIVLISPIVLPVIAGVSVAFIAKHFWNNYLFPGKNDLTNKMLAAK